MGFICTMIAETKLLAIREGCGIDMNDRGSKVLAEFFFCWEEMGYVGGRKRVRSIK